MRISHCLRLYMYIILVILLPLPRLCNCVGLFMCELHYNFHFMGFLRFHHLANFSQQSRSGLCCALEVSVPRQRHVVSRDICNVVWIENAFHWEYVYCLMYLKCSCVCILFLFSSAIQVLRLRITA